MCVLMRLMDNLCRHFASRWANMNISRQQFSRFSQDKDPSLIDVSLGDNSHRLFAESFLGYGANEAADRHRRSVLLSQLTIGSTKQKLLLGFSSNHSAPDPCMQNGQVKRASVVIDPDRLKSVALKEAVTAAAGFKEGGVYLQASLIFEHP